MTQRHCSGPQVHGLYLGACVPAGPRARPHAQGLGVQIGLGINQELAAEDHLIPGFQTTENDRTLAHGLPRLHRHNAVAAGRDHLDDAGALAGPDHGLARHAENWSLPRRPEGDGGKHVGLQRAIRIVEDQACTQGSGGTVQPGVDQIDLPLPAPCRIRRNGCSRGRTLPQCSRMTFGDIYGDPDAAEIGQGHHHGAGGNELSRPCIQRSDHQRLLRPLLGVLARAAAPLKGSNLISGVTQRHQPFRGGDPQRPVTTGGQILALRRYQLGRKQGKQQFAGLDALAGRRHTDLLQPALGAGMHHLQAVFIPAHRTNGTDRSGQHLALSNGRAHAEALFHRRFNLHIGAGLAAATAIRHEIHAHGRLARFIAAKARIHGRDPVFGSGAVTGAVAGSGRRHFGSHAPALLAKHESQACRHHNGNSAARPSFDTHGVDSENNCLSSEPPVIRAIWARCENCRARACSSPKRADNSASSASITASISPRPLA